MRPTGWVYFSWAFDEGLVEKSSAGMAGLEKRRPQCASAQPRPKHLLVCVKGMLKGNNGEEKVKISANGGAVPAQRGPDTAIVVGFRALAETEAQLPKTV